MVNNGHGHTNLFNERIGEVAGRLWRQLRAHGPQSPGALARSIGRSELEVYQGIGWLAREGKLRMDMADKEGRVTLMEHEMSVSI